MNRVAVVWKMENARHFRFCFAICAGERHRERALNRIRRQTKIFVTASKLTMKIDPELIGCVGCEIEIGGVKRCGQRNCGEHRHPLLFHKKSWAGRDSNPEPTP